MCATHAPAGSGHAAVASRPPRRLQSPPLVSSVTLCTSYVSTSSRRSPLLHLPPLPPLRLHIPQYLVSSNHFFTFTILFWFTMPFSMTYWLVTYWFRMSWSVLVNNLLFKAGVQRFGAPEPVIFLSKCIVGLQRLILQQFSC